MSHRLAPISSLAFLAVLVAGCGGSGGGGSNAPPLPKLRTVISYGAILGKYQLLITDKYPKRLDTLVIEHTGTEGEISYSLTERTGAIRANPPRGTMKAGEKATVVIEAVGLSYVGTRLQLTCTYLDRTSTDQFDVPFSVVLNDGQFPGKKLVDVVTTVDPPNRYLLTPNLTYPVTLKGGSVKYTADEGLPLKYEVVDQLGHVVATPAAGSLEAIKGKPNDPKRSATIALKAMRSTFGISRLNLVVQYDVLAHGDRLVVPWAIKNVAPHYLAARTAIDVIGTKDSRIQSRFWPPLVMAPYGVKVTHPGTNRALDRIPKLKWTEIEVVGAMSLPLTSGQLSAAFWTNKTTRGGAGEALFPPKNGRNGYTVHANRESAMPAGNYFFVHFTVENSVPLRDPVANNEYMYSFSFDSDGNTTNNYKPLASLPNDFHLGTDRWYDLSYKTATGWRLNVWSVDAANKVSEVSSAARMILADNSVLLVVPTTEFTSVAPMWRCSTFVFQAGQTEWSGDVMPDVTRSLLTAK